MTYQPPLTITPTIAHLLVDTAEAIGRLSAQHEQSLQLRRITVRSDSAPFIAFMLGMIRDAAISGGSPQGTLQVTPQVSALLKVLKQPMGRDELQRVLGLADRKSFWGRYLQPALAAGLIEMTMPANKPAKLCFYC